LRSSIFPSMTLTAFFRRSDCREDDPGMFSRKTPSIKKAHKKRAFTEVPAPVL
jgi:hypothetical protein